MAKQMVDDEDRLKRQARRRLIGAVALITAVVVVLPMVLDSEPKPAGQNIELRIPDRDKAGSFEPKMQAGVMASASAPAAMPLMLPASKPVAAAPVAPVSPAPAVKPAETVKAQIPAKPEEKAAAPAVKPAAASEKAAAPSSSPSAKTASGGSPSAAAPSARTGFVIQVGAFANANTAHSWQKNFVSQGYKAYTEKAGSKTRVRIGPYPTRDAANKARKKLEEKGLHVNVVDLSEK